MKTSSAVPVPLIPMTSSLPPTLNPGVPLSTTNAVIPAAPSATLPVLVKRTTTSARSPCEIQIFDPFILYEPLEVFSALVWMLAASDPAPGSVRP